MKFELRIRLRKFFFLLSAEETEKFDYKKMNICIAVY